MKLHYMERIELVPTKSPQIFTVALKLDHRTLLIGTLDKSGEGTFISSKKTEKHLFRKMNALGINAELCARFNFRWIMVPYCGRELWTSRLYILHHGKELTFAKTGYEAQLFLKLDEWDREESAAFEEELEVEGESSSGSAT
jgi:hypothetical protein